jgi:deoxyribose-phosphate aldolase
MTTISTSLPGTQDSSFGLPHWRTTAAVLDSTLLGPEATRADAERLCVQAAYYGFAALFVHATLLPYVAWALRGTSVKAGAPVGFPLGANLTSVKRFEAEELLRLGANELDMVINLGSLKSGDRALVQADIAAVVSVAHDAGAVCKVILETSLLDIHEKILGCELALAAGADFIKTSTGLNGGATVADVALLRGVVGERARIKASGGIRTLEQLTAMIDAGADRVGTSAAVEILRELGAPELA